MVYPEWYVDMGCLAFEKSFSDPLGQISKCNFCLLERTCVQCSRCGRLACSKVQTNGGCVDPYLLGRAVLEQKCVAFMCSQCTLATNEPIQVDEHSSYLSLR
jgi:hypothetical protein